MRATRTNQELCRIEQSAVFEEEDGQLVDNAASFAFVHHPTCKPGHIRLNEQVFTFQNLLSRERAKHGGSYHWQELRACARGDHQRGATQLVVGARSRAADDLQGRFGERNGRHGQDLEHVKRINRKGLRGEQPLQERGHDTLSRFPQRHVALRGDAGGPRSS